MDTDTKDKVISHLKSLQDSNKLNGDAILSVIESVEEKTKKDCLDKVRSFIDSLK